MDAVTQVVLQKLADEVTTAIKSELQYATDFKTDLRNLEEKLRILNGFFVDTDKLKEKQRVLKQVLVHLRDLAYDADDILTDCSIRDVHKKDRCCSFSLNDPIFAYKMGKKLKDLNSRMKNIEESMKTYLISQPPKMNGEENSGTVDKGLIISDSGSLVGFEEDLKTLKEWILCENGPKLEFVGLVGMGGSGKTTLASEIYNDKQVVDMFKKRIWKTVSQDYNEPRLIRSIKDKLGTPSQENPEGGDVNEPRQENPEGGDDSECYCLIVLDDIWKAFTQPSWLDLCCHLQNRRGQHTRIIITTRIEKAATDMKVSNSRIHYPKALDDEKSWLLFKKIAFSLGDSDCDDLNIIAEGKNIVKKCRGLPLAIKTIAASLQSKRTLSEWESVSQEFQLLITQEMTPVMVSLLLSYDALPLHLKQFLLCFSIYPEDCEIRGEQLVHWWVGEGLIQSGDKKTAINLGYEYLAELVGRCLVEVERGRSFERRFHTCKMHDLVRDLIIKIAGEEAFCSFEVGGKLQQRLTHNTRWLGVTDVNTLSSSLNQCSKLRAMILVSSSSINSSDIHLLSSLRVLDLSNGKLDDKSIENVFKWIIYLKRLAHLNLSGNPGVRQVPSIRKLRNLQLLILSGCMNLDSLNSSITFLKKLLVLDVRSCDELLFSPPGIGKLTQLQELSGFKVHRQANSQSCHLLELENLTELRVLRIKLSDKSEISDDEWKVFSKLLKLQVLAIDTESTEGHTISEQLDKLEPPQDLQQVYLRGYHRNILPKWISPQKLSKLKYMSIEFSDIERICLREENWKLVGLSLKFLLRFEDEWNKLRQNMPSLCEVEVSNCPHLKNAPYEENSWIWLK